jgi:Fur family ferric uptake transcriptional regulator
MRDNDHPSEQLHASGLKATFPRMRVLWVFQQAAHQQRHWTADEIYRRLLADGSGIGLATIYRVLAQLEQAGIVRRSRFDAERSVYELNDNSGHDHLVCLDSGEVQEFKDPELLARLREVADQRGFELMEHALTLYGVKRR